MISKLKQIPTRMLQMQEQAWWIWMHSLTLSWVLLLCAAALLWFGRPFTAANYHTYLSGQTLIQLSQLVLFLGILGSVCVEDQLS